MIKTILLLTTILGSVAHADEGFYISGNVGKALSSEFDINESILFSSIKALTL